MKPEYLTRQSDLIHSHITSERIEIIGAGAVGSFTALSLAKIGFEQIKVWDFDKVDDVNMNCQFFRISDIGKLKVDALKDLIRDFTGVEIETSSEPYEGERLSGVVITALDNMKTRNQVFEVNKKNLDVRYIVDPRMSAEFATMFVYSPMNSATVDSYSKTLFLDHESVQERCTAKSTMYTVNLIAGLVSKTVKNLLQGEDHMKNMMWDIANNDFNCFINERNKT